MTESAVVFTRSRDAAAGRELGAQITAKVPGRPPDALIVFASPTNDVAALLAGLRERCPAPVVMGCTSAGEFMSGATGEGTSCAVALRSTTMTFAATLARGIHENSTQAADRIAASFAGRENGGHRYRAALVLTDALAGFADQVVAQLTLRTAGRYQFFGGGAGDDARFTRTMVFCGTEIASDAVVALEILSDKPIGIGVRHGWQPTGLPLRVTAATGSSVLSLNAIPAADMFDEHARATGQHFDRADPLPFFLHNVLGIVSPGGFKLRVPLTVLADGGVGCAAEIPVGATVHFMRATASSSTEAATAATLDALHQIGTHKPNVALFFDCVATRLRMGRDFDLELSALQKALGDTPFAGFNTYGQVARADGQFSGFHNCTAVVCVIPE